MSAHRSVTGGSLPRPAGPYSPGVQFERLLFVSGQGAIDPATGELAGPDVETQTEQCLANVRAILEAAGSGLDHVLRCGVFLIDIAEFARMNAVYERMFGDHRPARTTIQAAALPRAGLRVEIDAVAYVPRRAAARGRTSQKKTAAARRAPSVRRRTGGRRVRAASGRRHAPDRRKPS